MSPIVCYSSFRLSNKETMLHGGRARKGGCEGQRTEWGTTNGLGFETNNHFWRWTNFANFQKWRTKVAKYAGFLRTIQIMSNDFSSLLNNFEVEKMDNCESLTLFINHSNLNPRIPIRMIWYRFCIYSRIRIQSTYRELD